jgi:hypothetical protein
VSRQKKQAAIEIAVSWRPCAECGEQRVLGTACSTCGKAPRRNEVNHHVVRRRQLVAAALDSMQAPEDRELFLDIHELSRRAGRVFPDVQEALRASAAEGVDGTALAAALERLQQLVVDSARAQPRPWTTVGRALHAAVAELQSAAEFFLGAFTAESLIRAQELAAKGQERLDAAADEARAFADALESQDRLGDATTESIFDVFGEVLASEAGHELDLTSVDAIGEDMARRVVGAETLEPGSGIAALWASIYARAFLDHDAFLAKARHSYALLRASGKLVSLHDDVTWATNHRAVTARMWDFGSTLEALLANARHDLGAARATLLFIQDMTEGPQKHLISTVLAASQGKSYIQLVRRDGGVLIKMTQQLFTDPPILSARTNDLRNASAHLDFNVVGDNIILRPGEHQIILESHEFGDVALRALEDLLALQLAVELALQQSNVTDEVPNPELSVRVLMAVSGYHSVKITQNDTHLLLDAEGHLRKPVPLTGAVLALYPDIERLTLTIAEDRVTAHVLEVNASAFRRHSEAAAEDEMMKQLLFLEGCMQATIDGHPLITEAAFRHALSIHAGRALTTNQPIPVLRAIRATAQRIGDTQLASLITSLMRATRLLGEGQALDPATQAAIDALGEMESAAVINPFTWTDD